jgi:hypothetical protein
MNKWGKKPIGKMERHWEIKRKSLSTIPWNTNMGDGGAGEETKALEGQYTGWF